MRGPAPPFGGRLLTMPRTLQPVQPRRVVITGMSVATALGFEIDAFWEALLAGRSGLRHVTFVPEDVPLPVRVAGQIDDAALATALARYELDDPDRSNQIALYVVGRALEDARFPTDGRLPLDYDILVGTGHGNVSYNNAAVATFLSHGYRKLRPTSVVRLMANRPANIASIRYRLRGGSHVVSAACATASVAVADAFHRVRFGVASGAVAACCDTGMDVATFAAWNRLGVLSRIPEPERASRPFDVARDGLVMGEGGAAFVLEPLDTAQQRGARILGEILGAGLSSDAKHIVQPDADGQVRAIRAALASADLPPEAIDYVNAHGTSTKIADITEAASLRTAMGERGGTVPVSNTKAQLGHLMGATAGVELVATLQALRLGTIPFCANLDDPDPACPLNFVRGRPLVRPISVALKNSFAFGGTNVALILRRWEA